MTWIYGIMGNKGGPGKTAEVIGLAYALAKRDRKVAVVDMDAQGNATRRLGVDKAALITAGAPGVAELLDPKRPAHVADVAVQCGWPDEFAGNITVIPSLDREGLAERAEEAARPGASRRLRRALNADDWADDFHDVLIDTGPDVNHLLHMTLDAIDRAVLVTAMNHDSIEGALYLAGYIDTMRDDLGRPHMAVAGVVINAYDKDAARQVKHRQHLGETFARWGGEEIIWSPAVPYRLSLANSHDDALSVSAVWHAGASDLAPAYDDHASLLIDAQTGVLV
jgi:cellulose biosynthesis protein BcsQ